LKGGTIRLMPLASYKQRLRKDRTNKHIWKSTFRFALYICIVSLSKKVAGKKTMIIDPWTKQESVCLHFYNIHFPDSDECRQCSVSIVS
jgi:hypothetical protein